MALRASLGVVLAHILVVCGNETNDALFSFVANIDTNKHSLIGDFRSKVHAPEVTAEFGVDLSDYVEIDPIVISVNSLASNKLRDNRVVRVNFIFNGGVEGLLSQGVRNDDKEELDDWASGGSYVLGALLLLSFNVISEVRINSVLEVLDR